MAHDVDVSEKAGVRYLHFGSDWVQGAMRIARPYHLELAYTREMMACLLLRGDGQPGSPGAWPHQVVQVGLGAASLTRFIDKYLPHTHSTVVEINPGVVAVAQQCFKLPRPSARFEIVIDDGADFITHIDQRYDVIFIDGFGPDARPGRLDTPEFYAACRQRLSEQGILVCNLLGRSKGFAASADRIREAFADRSVVFPSCDSGNAVAFAAVGEPVSLSLDELRDRADALKAATSLDLRPTLSRLQLSASCPGGQLSL